MTERVEVRLPLQGGLSPAEPVDDTVVEIACDESGFSGSNLLDAATPLITHASVDLSGDEATALLEELRSGFRFSLTEFKSGQLLRGPRAGELTAWLLGELTGRAHVFVVDKEYFLVTRVVDLFLAEPSYAAGTRLTRELRSSALAIYRGRPVADGVWPGFLEAFVDLVRAVRRHRPDPAGVERFFRARDDLLRADLGTTASEVLTGLDRTRVLAVVDRLANDDRSIPPPLEPMLPALAETVLFWSRGHRQVLVIHDEQSALTPDRLRRLQQVLAGHGTPSPLAGVVSVDSRDDARVQVADLLAGCARRSVSAVRLGPFLSPTSLCDPSDL